MWVNAMLLVHQTRSSKVINVMWQGSTYVQHVQQLLQWHGRVYFSICAFGVVQHARTAQGELLKRTWCTSCKQEPLCMMRVNVILTQRGRLALQLVAA